MGWRSAWRRCTWLMGVRRFRWRVEGLAVGYGWTGSYVSMTNLVSNTGVVGSDVTGVGTARYSLAAAGLSLT